MGRTQYFHHCGLGSIPGLGTEIPYKSIACHSPKQNKTKQKTKPPNPKYSQEQPIFFSVFSFYMDVTQARGGIGAVVSGLPHSHGNTGSELHLQPILQLMATLDP